jgi:hypothetical protein
MITTETRKNKPMEETRMAEEMKVVHSSRRRSTTAKTAEKQEAKKTRKIITEEADEDVAGFEDVDEETSDTEQKTADTRTAPIAPTVQDEDEEDDEPEERTAPVITRKKIVTDSDESEEDTDDVQDSYNNDSDEETEQDTEDETVDENTDSDEEDTDSDEEDQYESDTEENVSDATEETDDEESASETDDDDEEDDDDSDDDLDLKDIEDDDDADSDGEDEATVDQDDAEEQRNVETEMFDDSDEANYHPKNRKKESSAKRAEAQSAVNQVESAGQTSKFEEMLDNKLLEAGKKKKRQLYSDGNVVLLGDTPEYVSAGEKKKREYLELLDSHESGRVLKGICTGTSYVGGKLCAVVRYGEYYRIIIPYEMFLKPKASDVEYMQENKKDAEKHIRLLMNHRIMSEVDFIVRGIDEEALTAVGDRLAAMHHMMEAYYFGKDRTGKWLINKGDLYEGRIVSTSVSNLIVEVRGMEFKVKPEDISYSRIPDVSQEYRVGETVPVRFTAVERERVKKGSYRITAKVSIKAASEDPRERYYNMYSRGTLVSAYVAALESFGIFCRLEDKFGKMDVLCKFDKSNKDEYRELPHIGDTVVLQITDKYHNEEEGYRMLGKIIYTVSHADN